MKFNIAQPTASIARAIEIAVISGSNSRNVFYKAGCAVASRIASVAIFPTVMTLELFATRIPKLIIACNNPSKWNTRLKKISKISLCLIASPLGLLYPESIAGFLLKRSNSSSIRPYGVEMEFGKQTDQICYPRTIAEVKRAVLTAKQQKKQISIVGEGMSQGTQTIPAYSRHLVINLKHLDHIQLAKDGKTVSVQAGANWEQLQIALNKQGKSAIVKQASDPFSIGGSIGINCHGWAHEYGALSSTVESLEVIDASGELKILTPKDELFGCMFGTLGYFGIVVSARLKVVDNVLLVQKTEEIDLDDFSKYYNSKIKGKDIPLFGGRLTLDQMDGDPLRKICMVRYEKKPHEIFSNLDLKPEPQFGTRYHRIGLKLLAHLPEGLSKMATTWFWEQERAQMLKEIRLTRNEALHPPINAFKMLHHSDLHAQWLQEYFIKEENLPNFLRFLGAELKANGVRLLNATIRPIPRDRISILPYAEQDRHGVVICFAQHKTNEAIAKTKKWIETVNNYLVSQGDVYYQAYMPFATREQFEACYGKDRVNTLRRLKKKHDPDHLFGNAHTEKYFDLKPARNL